MIAYQGSSVHGILQARILEWVAVPSSRGSSWPRNQTQVFCVSFTVGFFTCWAIRSVLKLTSMTGNWAQAVAVKAPDPSLARPPGNCNREADAAAVFPVLAQQWHTPLNNVRRLTWWPRAGTLRSQCRGPGLDPWSGNQIQRVTTRSSHAATKELTCHNWELWEPKGKEKDTN